jgi:hypothetical protein
MPPGAGANLLRSTGYFDGAGAGEHIAVLAVWALVGLAALCTAAASGRRLRAWRRSMPAVTESRMS